MPNRAGREADAGSEPKTVQRYSPEWFAGFSVRDCIPRSLCGSSNDGGPHAAAEYASWEISPGMRPRPSMSFKAA